MTSLFTRPYFCLAASRQAPLVGAAAHVCCDESRSAVRKNIARAILVMNFLPHLSVNDCSLDNPQAEKDRIRRASPANSAPAHVKTGHWGWKPASTQKRERNRIRSRVGPSWCGRGPLKRRCTGPQVMQRNVGT